MKVKKIFKWSPKKLKTALLPISVLSYILGIKTFQIPLGHRRTILTYIYTLTIIFSLIYTYVKDGTKLCLYGEKLLPVGHKVVIFAYACNQLSAIVSLILTLFMSKETELCIERMELLNRNLYNDFQSADVYRKIFFNTVLIITALFTVQFANFFLEIFIFKKTATIELLLYCSLFYKLPVIIQSTIDFTFGLLVICIGYSFKHLNNIIKMESQFFLLKTEFHKKHVKRKLDMIRIIKLQHLELSNIAGKINEIYQFQILISIFVNFISQIVIVYLIFVTYFEKNMDTETAISIYIVEIFLCIVFVNRFIYVNNACKNVSLEVCKTVEHLLYLSQDTNIVSEINEFIEQIEQCPLKFNIFGIQLGHRLITFFVLAIADRLTIVLQLYPARET